MILLLLFLATLGVASTVLTACLMLAKATLARADVWHRWLVGALGSGFFAFLARVLWVHYTRGARPPR